jgi:hypothetical protein
VFPLEPGNPPSFMGPGASSLALDLLSQLLVFDPARRLTAPEALRHAWFSSDPLPAPPNRLPISLQRHAAAAIAPPAALAPAAAAAARGVRR